MDETYVINGLTEVVDVWSNIFYQRIDKGGRRKENHIHSTDQQSPIFIPRINRVPYSIKKTYRDICFKIPEEVIIIYNL